MIGQMIYRYSVDTYIYTIDKHYMLVVRGWAWQAFLDAGYDSDVLYVFSFWMRFVGLPGITIEEPPYPAEYGRF